MAISSTTMLASPARADESTMELVAGSCDQVPDHPQRPSVNSSAALAPGRASQLDRTRSEQGTPNPTKIVSVASPVVIDGPRQINNCTTLEGREAVKPRNPLRDSACVITSPLALQPEAARPLSPSASTTTEPAADKSEQPHACNDIQNRCAELPGNVASTDSATTTVDPTPTVMAATVNHGSEHQNSSNNYSPWPRNLSHEDFTKLYHERGHQQLQAVIDSGVFNWPPKNLEKAHERLTRTTFGYEPPPPNFKLNIGVTEALVEIHSNFWAPFVPQVEEEMRQLSVLEKAASDKFATRKGVEKAIIKVRMQLRAKAMNKGQFCSPGASFSNLQTLLDLEKTLDADIASIHAEWKDRVKNLYESIETHLRPEYHENEVKEEVMAAQRKEQAKKTEFHRIMRFAGWGEMPYLGATAPGQIFQPGTAGITTVPTWFDTLDAAGVVELSGEQPRQRYINLLNTVHDLEMKRRGQAKQDPSPPPEPKKLRKSWHEQDPHWPHPSWQKNGGWWVCRTGPGASAAEEQCKECRVKRDTRAVQQEESRQEKPTASETYDKIVTEMHKALGPQMEKDKEVVKERRRAEKEAVRAKKAQLAYRNGWDGGYLPKSS